MILPLQGRTLRYSYQYAKRGFDWVVQYLEQLGHRESISLSNENDAVMARGWRMSVSSKPQERVGLLCTTAALILSFFLFANTSGCHIVHVDNYSAFDTIATQASCDCLLLLFFLIAVDLNCARFVDG